MFGEALGFADQVLHLVAGLLLAHGSQHVLSLLEAFRGFAGVGLPFRLFLLLLTLLALLLGTGLGGS